MSTATSGAVTSTYIAGVGLWSASGAIADVNALLAGVSFTPTLNYNSNFTIATSVSDGVAAVTGSENITRTAANKAPPPPNLRAAAASTTENGPNLTHPVVSDAGSPS